MAVNPVTLAESLRPWRSAGLMVLLSDLCEGEENDSAFCDADADTALLDNQPQEANGFSSAMQSGHVAPVPSSSLVTAPPVAGPYLQGTPQAHSEVNAPMPLPHRVDAAALSASSDTVATSHSAPAVSNPSDWPEAWAALFARTKPAPIIWTYAELGEDLSGVADASRSACLRDVIGKLQLPRGTNAFWPVTLPDRSEQHPETSAEAHASPTYFAAALPLLKPSVVVFLGKGALALSGLPLTLSTPFTQCIYKGVLFALLPEIHSLSKTPSQRDSAFLFLRSALSAYPAIFHQRER